MRSLALVVVLGLAACGDDAAAPPCGGLCDDGDPCTDDRCLEGRCVFVPAGAANACRTDQHCDDGVDCSIDSCALDACGFQRCRHELPDGCALCSTSFDCDDNDACTVDACQSGACVNIASPQCDRRCDPDGMPDDPDRVRLYGLIGWYDGCACPCSTEATLSDWVLDTDEPSSCTIACDGNVSCTPFPLGTAWIMEGTMTESGGFTPASWCMAHDVLQDRERRWTGTLTWSNVPGSDATVHIRTAFGDYSVEPSPCPGCSIILREQTSFFDRLMGLDNRIVLFARHEGRERRLATQIYLDTDQLHVVMVSTDDDDVPIEGHMTMTLEAP